MRPSKPKFSWLLAGSLALNAALAVALGFSGPWAHPPGPPGPRHRPPPPSAIADRIVQQLSAEDAALFRQAFARHLPVLERDYQSLSTTPEQIRQLLTAPQLDETALRAALEEMDMIRQRFGQAMSDTTLEAAGRMSPEGRAKLWHPPGPPGP